MHTGGWNLFFSKGLFPTIINDKLRKKHDNEEKTAIIIHTIKSFATKSLKQYKWEKERMKYRVRNKYRTV